MLYQLNPDCAAEGGLSPKGSPDLSLLVAPMYAFLWWQTGQQRFLDRGDAIWSGGVTSAYLDYGKQFDESYWWSFDYVKWRNPGSVPPAPTQLLVR